MEAARHGDEVLIVTMTAQHCTGEKAVTGNVKNAKMLGCNSDIVYLRLGQGGLMVLGQLLEIWNIRIIENIQYSSPALPWLSS